ncbi:hypothetical protein [Klebsiella sp. S69]|uniref:hypothetical protein n=1 Tax=Klebsiella sp. S69 TaxID=2767439 RepID=UPI001908DF88|nr:hypothetical protein [Klebsiella sp. S69]MBK0167484.1 hypothetical protein [Klebsiella sp. S69]
MLEPSIIFFYCFVVFVLSIPVVMFIKSESKKDEIKGLLIFVLFAIAAGYLFDSKDPLPSILKIISSIFIIFFVILLLYFFKDQLSIKKAISTAMNKIKSDIDYNITDIFALKGSLFIKKQWYIVLYPERNIVLIGINEYNQNLYLNKYLCLYMLSGERMKFSHLFPLKGSTDDESLFIGPLKEFYYSDESNKKIVDDYLLKLKNEKF